MNDTIFDGLKRSRYDPFRTIDLTIEMVDATAGAQKSRTAVRISVERAKSGRKTIHTSPTLELTKEKIAFARECDPNVKIYEITGDPNRSQYRKSAGGVGRRICEFIERHAAGGGLLLFITHEGFDRVTAWPEETKAFDLIIDEAPQVVLTRQPLNLRYSHWTLTNFLNTDAIPTTLAERNSKRKPPPEFTYNDPDIPNYIDQKTDQSKAFSHALRIEPGYGAAEAEIDMAYKELLKLKEKRDAWEAWLKEDNNTRIHGEAKTYYLVTAQEEEGLADPLQWIKLRQNGVDVDDIYKYLDPIPRWLLQGAVLFTDMNAWNAMIIKPDPENPVEDRGRVTIIGFRRPDMLQSFNKVTMMGALFTHTFTYMVWKQLGVKFVPSREIDIDVPTTNLGKRRLNIYWLYDEGWSRYTKELSGGIEPVLDLIKQSKVIAADAEVCVVLNKDDGGPENPAVIHKAFRNAIPMPHNSKGQNRFRHYHQLIHLAALNAYTPDIRWMTLVLGIDADQQRIARTGQEVYQTAMRTSLREPSSTHDVDIVVADKAVAEWLVQWFDPVSQVSVFEIDSTGVIKRKNKRGPKPMFDKNLTQAERNRRHRAKKRLETQDS